MDAYMYQADIYCESCGEFLRKLLWAQIANSCEAAYHKPETEYDSQAYPKGPYPDGGGENDVPQNCASCGVYLQNPLTPAGINYVFEAIGDDPGRRSQTVRVWAESLRDYTLTISQRAALEGYLRPFANEESSSSTS